VREIAISGRVLDLLIGPAGTGKTASLAGLRAAWEPQYGPGSVIGLAPSAAAAEVLADELGIESENIAKWVTEARRDPDRAAQIDIRAAHRSCAIREGAASRRNRGTATGRAASARREAAAPPLHRPGATPVASE
jgi:hypothetical protein